MKKIHEIWYWKGFVHKGDGRLLSNFVKLDDEYKIIENFMYLIKNKNKDSYILGGKYKIEVTRENEEAKSIGTRVYMDEDLNSGIVSNWRKEHWAESEEAQKFKDLEKAKKDSVNIENLKVKDLKNYASKNWQNRRALKSYLENLF